MRCCVQSLAAHSKGNSVLKSNALKFHCMCPLHDLCEQTYYPLDYLALAGAWKTMYQAAHGFFSWVGNPDLLGSAIYNMLCETRSDQQFYLSQQTLSHTT